MTYKINQMSLISAISAELSRQVPNMPFEPRFYNRIVSAANSICDELSTPVVKASDGMGLTAWLASDDVGMSSKYMAAVLSGKFTADFAYPHDPSDFGRCLRMIRACPEFEGLIHRMCSKGRQWEAVANNWEEWAKLYDIAAASPDGKATELYRLMKEAYFV